MKFSVIVSIAATACVVAAVPYSNSYESDPVVPVEVEQTYEPPTIENVPVVDPVPEVVPVVDPTPEVVPVVDPTPQVVPVVDPTPEVVPVVNPVERPVPVVPVSSYTSPIPVVVPIEKVPVVEEVPVTHGYDYVPPTIEAVDPEYYAPARPVRGNGRGKVIANQFMNSFLKDNSAKELEDMMGSITESGSKDPVQAAGLKTIAVNAPKSRENFLACENAFDILCEKTCTYLINEGYQYTQFEELCPEQQVEELCESWDEVCEEEFVEVTVEEVHSCNEKAVFLQDAMHFVPKKGQKAARGLKSRDDTIVAQVEQPSDFFNSDVYHRCCEMYPDSVIAIQNANKEAIKNANKNANKNAKPAAKSATTEAAKPKTSAA